MKIKFTVDLELDHESGVFASKDELGGILETEIEGAIPSDVEGEGGGSYTISSVEVFYVPGS